MKENALLTVIVPVYNGEKYLDQCVSSIRQQTYENLEILLVDDGSPDRSGEMCDQYAAQDSRIRVIHKENEGQSLARNLAIDQARGQYITFVDCDDWIAPQAYEEMLALMERTGAKIVCGGRYNVSEKTGERTLGLCPQREEVLDCPQMLTRMFTWQGCDSAPCDKIFGRSLFEGVRFPREIGSEDIGVLYKLVIRAQKIAMYPKPYYHYLQRAGSTSYGQVSPRLFHFPLRTETLYADIRSQVPEAIAPARYLRVRSLAYPLLLLDQADAQTRKPYESQMKRCRSSLRRHIWFLLTGPYFGKQERLTDILLAFNWYRGLRRLYHR